MGKCHEFPCGLLHGFCWRSLSNVSSSELDLHVWMIQERSKLKTGESDWHLHWLWWKSWLNMQLLRERENKRALKNPFIKDRRWRTRHPWRWRRSAGKLEGNHEKGGLPKSMQGNVSRRECVSGLKAVFNFGKAWNFTLLPTVKLLGWFLSPPLGKSLFWQDSY